MLSCCEFHKKIECSQGDSCPIRTFYAENDPSYGEDAKAKSEPHQPLPVLDIDGQLVGEFSDLTAGEISLIGLAVLACCGLSCYLIVRAVMQIAAVFPL